MAARDLHMIDRYVSSARNLSILVTTVALTAIFLAFVELKDLSAFRETRNLIARWLLYDRLQEEAEVWRAFNEDSNQFKLSLSWRKGGSQKYYRNFGYVICRQRPTVFDVEIKQPPPEEADAPLMARIADLRPWKTTIPATGILVQIFEPISKEKLEFSKRAKTMVQKGRETSTPEEIKGLNPSYLDERTYDPVWFPLSYEKYLVGLQLGVCAAERQLVV